MATLDGGTMQTLDTPAPPAAVLARSTATSQHTAGAHPARRRCGVERVASPLSTKPARAARGSFVSFAKFVLVGGGFGLASSVAVPMTATVVPWVTANALITVVSTVLSTELHARCIFGARG